MAASLLSLAKKWRIPYSVYRRNKIILSSIVPNLHQLLRRGDGRGLRCISELVQSSVCAQRGCYQLLVRALPSQHSRIPVRYWSDDSHYRRSHPRPDEDPNNNQPPEQLNWPQLIFGFMAITMYYLLQGSDPIPEVPFPFFLQHMLNTGEVLRLEVSSSRDKVYVYLHAGAVVNGNEVRPHGPHFIFTISSTDALEGKLRAAQESLGVDPASFLPVIYRKQSDILPTVVSSLVTVAVIGFLWYFVSSRSGRGARGGEGIGMSGFNPFAQMSKAKSTVITESSAGRMKISDVAGMEEAKQEVMEFIDYLKSPSQFTHLGARIPKGALLFGPPGTGKTLLAKAVAGEASVPFISIAGSDFVEMFAGVGSARVRDLFGQARKMAPCILYIDEVDAIGRSRQSRPTSGGHHEQESTLNQLLVEMDGINPLEGVVMLASTNRVDILDQALLRPGRFDRQISIELPTLLERQAIFELYLKQLKLEKSVEHYSKRLAALTPGHSGADIANICNEAALHAAREGGREVVSENLEYAIERVIAGMEKHNNPLSAEERQVVAYHEAGHALVGWLLEHTDPILKISIIPRTKGMLGFAQYLPSDQKLYTREQLMDRMCMAMGGRAAEAIIFKRITTGAQDDIKRVTDMAQNAVTVLGMSPAIGNVSFPTREEIGLGTKPYSDKLAGDIDREVREMVGGTYERAVAILTENSSKLKELAEQLLAQEVLNHTDIVRIVGPMPHRKPFHPDTSEL